MVFKDLTLCGSIVDFLVYLTMTVALNYRAPLLTESEFLVNSVKQTNINQRCLYKG